MLNSLDADDDDSEDAEDSMDSDGNEDLEDYIIQRLPIQMQRDIRFQRLRTENAE